MAAILNRDHPHADIAGLLNGDLHRFRGDDYSQTTIGVNAGYRRRFAQNFPLRGGVDQFIFIKPDIPLKNVRDTVAGHTPQVGGNQDVGGQTAVVFGNAHFFENSDSCFTQV